MDSALPQTFAAGLNLWAEAFRSKRIVGFLGIGGEGFAVIFADGNEVIFVGREEDAPLGIAGDAAQVDDVGAVYA